MEAFRIETDLLGEKEIPINAYYGINTLRAFENFKISSKTVNYKLIEALVLVKKAAAKANETVKTLSKEKAEAIVKACDKILEGNLKDQFITDSLQGGAGTSTNMNVNEVIANVALELLGEPLGSYNIIHPLEHVNLSQSTNDVYPTALRIAAIWLLRPLSESFSKLQDVLQQKENQFSSIIKLGRTELMDAVPITVGQEFGAYAKAIARDRWRLYKVEERLREINIGGTAIGTGINASQKYIYLVTDIIQDLTHLGLSRSDYPIDTTQNMDVFVEVSGLLKAAAVNLIKISNDLRLLSSGPKGGFGEIKISPVQAGSTIMPGKVNPVILEMVSQVSMKVLANDNSITLAAMNGQLELNAFSPLIAESILESLELMTNAVNTLTYKCITTIQVDEAKCLQNLNNSTSIVAALINYLGYDKASEVSKKSIIENKTITELVLEEKLICEDKLKEILNVYNLTSPGIPGK